MSASSTHSITPNALGTELPVPHVAGRNPDSGSSRTGRQITRFLCVGGSSVAVDLVCYWFLLGSLSPIPAKGLSYLAGMAVGFIGNKLWTFESKQKNLSEPALYVLVYAVSLLVNIGLNSGTLWTLNRFVELPWFNRSVAFLAATGTTTVLNFVGLKFIAFRSVQHTIPSETQSGNEQ